MFTEKKNITLQTSLGHLPSIFYDRIDLVNEIESKISDPNSFTFIYGEAGSGKTTISRRCAHKFLLKPHHNRIVLEIRSEFDNRVREFYLDLLKKSNHYVSNLVTLDCNGLIEEVNKVFEFLQDSKEILLIFDHVESFQIISKYLYGLLGMENIRVILTTSNKFILDEMSYDWNQKFDLIKCKYFNKNEFFRFTLQILEKQDQEITNNELEMLFEIMSRDKRKVCPFNANRAIMLIKNNNGDSIERLIRHLKENARQMFVGLA
jgi:hypothetical protein